MTDLRVETRFKNARLYNAIATCFPPTKEGSSMKLAAAHAGISYQVVGAFVNLTFTPFHLKGGFRGSAKALASALGESPENLFPARLYGGELGGVFVREVESIRLVGLDKARAISAPDLEDRIEANLGITEALEASTLTDTQKEVIRLRFGLEDGQEWSQREIGKKLGVTGGRVGQIEAQALRILRYPTTRNRPLIKHLETLEDAGIL